MDNFSKMIYVKVHEGSSKVVAVCDEELIGKEFREGKVCLKVSENFYKGDKKSVEEVKEIMENAGNLNIVGKESINIALELGIIEKDSIVIIQGVPHAQAVTR